MPLKRIMVGALTSAALVSAAFAAPAPASDTSLDASGSQTVPLGTVGGCTRYITIWRNTTSYPYAGTSRHRQVKSAGRPSTIAERSVTDRRHIVVDRHYPWWGKE